MPQENEIKYVLRNYTSLERKLLKLFPPTDIAPQAYLNDSTRIRRMVSPDQTIHRFSFKQRIDDGKYIEVETDISESDFYGLLPFAPLVLEKRRFSFFRGEVRWDIDFPRWKNGQHFAVAEVEMPPHMHVPPSIPDEIHEHIVYAVPRKDKRFSARRLADEKYSLSLAKTLDL